MRRRRNFYSGGVYHLIQRGHNRSFIFQEPSDKAFFLTLLRETLAKYPSRLLYYVLMGNHYHILLEMCDTPIDVIMQRINQEYGRYYKLKHQNTGAAYQGRYKAYLVRDDRYFLQLILYIANNPVKAGIVEKIADYPWSAHQELSDIHSAKQQSETLIDRERLLELLGGTIPMALEEYNDLIAGLSAHVEEPIQSGFINARRIDRLQQLLQDSIQPPLTLDVIQSASLEPKIFATRRALARKSHAQGYTTDEIANVLNISRKTASRWVYH